jgi:hypothetical protein
MKLTSVPDGEAPHVADAAGGGEPKPEHQDGIRQVGPQEGWKGGSSPAQDQCFIITTYYRRDPGTFSAKNWQCSLNVMP